MDMSDIADRLNKVSNRTALIVILGVASMVGTGLKTYYDVTGAFKDFKSEYRYDRKLQSIRDSLQDVKIDGKLIAKYP